MNIEEITSTDFLEGLEKTQTVLIPVGATEGHGAHLPLGTDSFQALDVCQRLAEQRALFVAPLISYGVCRSTGQHPGTLSIRTETLKCLMIDIVEALYRQGLRNFVVLSGHAGGTHNAVLIDAGEALLTLLPEAKIAVVTEYDLVAGEGDGLVETVGDSHAGEIETSRILATRPHLVKTGSVEAYPGFAKHILVRNKKAYWPSAVCGDPGKASAEKGVKIEELVVKALERLVVDLEAFVELP